MTSTPAPLRPLSSKHQRGAKRGRARADDQQGAVALRGRAPQSMLQTRLTSVAREHRTIQHHQTKSSRGGELFGRPRRLRDLFGAHEEHPIFQREIHPIERLQATRAVDDRHPPSRDDSVVYDGAEQGGPADAMLTDPGRHCAHWEATAQELIEGRQPRREPRRSFEGLLLAPWDHLRVTHRDLSAKLIEGRGGSRHTEHMNSNLPGDQASCCALDLLNGS
jgi:hypothetical protein